MFFKHLVRNAVNQRVDGKSFSLLSGGNAGSEPACLLWSKVVAVRLDSASSS